MKETNVNDFIEELGAGVFREKLAHALSEAALATVLHGVQAAHLVGRSTSRPAHRLN